MISEKVVRDIVEAKLADSDQYLIDVVVSTGNKITVLVDGDSGVSIKDCVQISRAVEGQLDREKEDFALEVSSPGLSQPFRVLRQYNKNLGKLVDVTKVDGSKIDGKLIEVDDKGIKLDLNRKKKKNQIDEELYVPFKEISETKVIISFK